MTFPILTNGTDLFDFANRSQTEEIKVIPNNNSYGPYILVDISKNGISSPITFYFFGEFLNSDDIIYGSCGVNTLGIFGIFEYKGMICTKMVHTMEKALRIEPDFVLLNLEQIQRALEYGGHGSFSVSKSVSKEDFIFP